MSASTPLPDAGSFGRFEILAGERRLRVDGQPVSLGSRAFDLLAALVARRDRVVSKDELIDVVWPGLVVEENNLQVQISALRKVLGAQAIATVPGRGYQFTVAAASSASPVPASARPDAMPWRPPERAGDAALRKARLLVADDNKVNRLLLCRSLELMGHDVESADNGRVALEMMRSGRFDMLLLDLEMPEMDGFALLGERAADPALREVPVIVTSSLEGAAQVARCIELGADDFLHKPVNPVLLKARVDSSLERKRLRDRQRELLARLAPDLHEGAPAAGVAGGRRVEATLLVARLHDIDALAASQPPHETLELLGSWSTLMVDAIEEHQGSVQQLGGDAVTAAFGAHEPVRGDGGTPWAAAQAALEMVELIRLFNAERVAAGKAPLALGIGIASGEVVAGHAGTRHRAAHVCVGAPVRRAAALERLATRSARTVLIDAATEAILVGRAATEGMPPATLPGSAAAVPVYALRTTS
jgi:DNA-binding response OmpR family regulator